METWSIEEQSSPFYLEILSAWRREAFGKTSSSQRGLVREQERDISQGPGVTGQRGMA